MHLDVRLQCASNHRRACVCDALHCCFHDALHCPLPMDQVQREDMAGWRQTVCYSEPLPTAPADPPGSMRPRAPSLLKRMSQVLPKRKSGTASLLSAAEAEGGARGARPNAPEDLCAAAGVGTGVILTGAPGEVILYTIRSGRSGMVAQPELVTFASL